MLKNYKELLAQKKELVKITKDLDDYAVQLLDKKIDLINQIDEITQEQIKPRKDEISQIDAEIETIMHETGQDKIVSDRYGAYMSNNITIKIVDPLKALEWARKYPQVLKKDIIKASEVGALLKEGIVPDPDIHGIDCNDSYQKVTYRRK